MDVALSTRKLNTIKVSVPSKICSLLDKIDILRVEVEISKYSRAKFDCCIN